MPLIAFISGLFVFLFPASLQASRAENSIQCAAVYLIASSTSPDKKEVTKTFHNLQIMFEKIYAVTEEKRLNVFITNEMISKKKAELATRLEWKYVTDPQSVYAIEMQCNAWRKLIAPYVSKKIGLSSNKTFIRSAFRSTPNIPEVPDKNDPRWGKSKLLVDRSFIEWEKLGTETRKAYRKKFKHDNKESKHSSSAAFKESHLEPKFRVPDRIKPIPSKSVFDLSSLTLRCDILKDCGDLDEDMCKVLNFGPKERTAIATFNTKSNTIRWEEFYDQKRKSGFIKYWKIIVNSEKVIGAVAIPNNRRGFNSFLLDKETMKIATNAIFSSKQNKEIEHSKNLKRFKCEKY